MTSKLIQKHLLKGSREFEIIDDRVEVRIKEPFKEMESLSVMLSVLNPEPVISKSGLDFTSRVNGEALLSLYLGKPNTDVFNAFVNKLKQKALEEYNAFAGLKQVGQPAGLGANVYEEPPEFEDSDEERIAKITKKVNSAMIEEAIQMLKTYLDFDDDTPLVSSLAALQAETTNEAHLINVINAFNELGAQQGAVLTYAPYVGILLYDDPFSPR